MATHGFDGVDIALEFPDEDVPDDRAALTTFLEVDALGTNGFIRDDENFDLLGISKTEAIDVTFVDHPDRCTVCGTSAEGLRYSKNWEVWGTRRMIASVFSIRFSLVRLVNYINLMTFDFYGTYIIPIEFNTHYLIR